MTTYTAVLDGSKTNVEGHSKFLNRLFAPGVASGFNTTSLKVTQRGAGANLSVDVSVGDAHLQLPNTNYSFWSWTDAVTNVVLAAADATNPRIDVIVAWVDTAATTTASNNSPGSLKFSAMTGTPAGSPSAMSDSAIQSALGASVAWVKLANVAVAATTVTITNANITDARTGIKPILPTDAIPTDWGNLLVTPTVSATNGQKETVLLYSGVDYTDRLQKGTKLRIPRTVAAPTQCTTLNGTSQYWSDSTVSGMTFTDDFTVSAWVKLSSYPTSNGYIISRFNGTSGWGLNVQPTGQVSLIGFNGGVSNYRAVVSYQTLPLNRWVHISAQLDMSAFTTSTTTCYVMIDGVDVPCSLGQSGTNPTSLIQAGNLEVGSAGAGNFFPGKIAQAAVFSAKVTQANLRGYIGKGLLGTETSLLSAYSFNGSANDLNGTNANHLTAFGGTTATTVDSPFSSTEYGIITDLVYSGGNTSVTVFTGPYVIPNETLGTTGYSSARAPYGFNANRDKWAIYAYNRADSTFTVGSAATTYYAFPGLTVYAPVGEWVLTKQVGEILFSGTAAAVINGRTVISTEPVAAMASFSSTAAFINEFSTRWGGAPNATELNVAVSMSAPVSPTVATTYRFGARTESAAGTYTIRHIGSSADSISYLKLDCAYL